MTPRRRFGRPSRRAIQSTLVKAEVSFQSASNILDDLGEAASDSASAERLKTWTGHVQKYRDFEATLQKVKGRNEAFATIEGKQAVSDATGLGADLANAGEAFNRQLEATTIAEFLATKHCASLKILRRTKAIVEKS